MAKKMTAISVMMVVFFTSLAVGHETRLISARTSRKNCAMRPGKPGLAALRLRSRLSTKRAERDVGICACGFSKSSMMSPAFFDTHAAFFQTTLAGVPGFEPGLSVLETDVLTIDTIPLHRKDAGTRRRGDTGNRQSPCLPVSVSVHYFVSL